MTIAFYEHPLSSYVQKAKTALYEKGIPFESKMIDGSEPVATRRSRRPFALDRVGLVAGRPVCWI
jgi:glutathione S-transferase